MAKTSAKKIFPARKEKKRLELRKKRTRKKRLSRGSNTDETRINDENLEQEQTEETFVAADRPRQVLCGSFSMVLLRQGSLARRNICRAWEADRLPEQH